jgi:YspA, cpYpsA-related SLOG family
VRLLLTGSQGWTEGGLIEIAMLVEVGDTPWHEVLVVHGGCKKGADKIVDEIARRRGWGRLIMPADWAHYGNAAGQIRNERMVKMGADVCIAFIREKSPGASTTARKADRAGIRTVVWRHEGDRVWLEDEKVDATRVNPDQGELF